MIDPVRWDDAMDDDAATRGEYLDAVYAATHGEAPETRHVRPRAARTEKRESAPP